MSKLLLSFRCALLGVFGLLMLVGCQAPPIQVFYVLEDINVDKIQTFRVEPLFIVSDTANNFFDQAIALQMQSKGYVSDEALPDILVRYYIDSKSSTRVKTEKISITERGQSDSKVTLEAVLEGSILINAIDTHTDEVIWKATATRDLVGNKKGLDKVRITGDLERIFDSFPSK